MKENEVNWKDVWKEPEKILEIIAKNDECVVKLKLIERKIKNDKTIERKIKSSGYIIEGKKKEEIISMISEIDAKLYSEIKMITNREQAIKIISNRITELQKLGSQARNLFNKILKKQNKTINSGASVVEKYLFALDELKEIYIKQSKNIELNEKYRKDLVLSSENKKLLENIKHYENEAKKAANRSKENRELENKSILLIEEVAKMKEEAKKIQNEFEKETDEINKILSLMSQETFEIKERKKSEEKIQNVNNLRLAWGRT